MPHELRLAVVGLGRIGKIHALHAHRLGGSGQARLTALVDPDLPRAEKLAAELGGDLAVYSTVEELTVAKGADAAVVSTPTGMHRQHAQTLIDAGLRVLLEKPMTDSLAGDREFTAALNRTAPDALMLAFQRRFDPALMRAKQLLQEGAIGRAFKIVSTLEDSAPLPDGYDSAGLLYDMAVHNVDEILWLCGQRPRAAFATATPLHSHRLTSANEEFDDGFLQLWFDGELSAQIQVSRNHVSGYRVETWIYGEGGQIHLGAFRQDPHEVELEVYGRSKSIAHERFQLERYDRPVPEFVDRFGLAYQAELAHFVDCCLEGKPFGVDQNDGLAAMEAIDAAVGSLLRPERAARVTV
jgi:predicted dehydrogenase